MNKRIKLIWDFYGEDAQKTAEHHAIHLKEFVTKHKIESFNVGTTVENNSTMAYVVVGEENMILLRDSLRPKRGQWVEDKN